MPKKKAERTHPLTSSSKVTLAEKGTVALQFILLLLLLARSLQDRIRWAKFVMFDKLLLPQNVLKLVRVMQSGVSGMLLTYLHGLRHGTDTYVLGLPMTFPWLLSSLSIRQSWWCFLQTILQHAAWSTIVCLPGCCTWSHPALGHQWLQTGTKCLPSCDQQLR